MTRIARSYTLMLMRDDGKALRLRLSARVLRVLLLLFMALFPLVAGLGSWLAWNLWQDRLEYSAHRAAEQTALADAQAELARLNNLKLFLEQRAPLTLSGLLHPTETPEPPPGVDPAVYAQLAELTQMEKLLHSGVAQVAAQAEQSAKGTPAATQPAQPPANGSQPAAAATQPTPPATPQSTMTTPGLESVPEPPLPGDDTLSSGLVRVENLLLSRSGTSGLRVSFDIYNTEQQPQVSGSTTFELVQPSGITPLTAQGDISFRIKRLKKIVGYPNLPRAALPAEAKLRINVTGEDGTILYRVDLPLP